MRQTGGIFRAGLICAFLVAALPSFAVASPGYDPGVLGPYDTAQLRAHEGNRATKVGLRFPVELTSEVAYPTTADGAILSGRHPVVAILHGEHASCMRKNRSSSDMWPCKRGWRPFPNYLGYRYATRLLASQGYITVSISSDGIDGQDNLYSPDGGDTARARLIDAHLRLLAGRSPGDVRGHKQPYPRRIRRAVDMDRTMLVGHSRGGEGMAATAVRALTDKRPYDIRALVALASTNGAFRVVPHVPHTVVLPQCDGDVFDLEGQMYADTPRLIPDDPALRSAVWLPHANHNFLNKMWTPGQSVTPQEDDAKTYDDTDGYCRAGARLSPAHERRAARAYVAATADLWLRDDLRALPLLDGRPHDLPSTAPVDVRVSAAAGAATLLQHEWQEPVESSGAIQSFTCTAKPCAHHVDWSSPWLPHWLTLTDMPGLPSHRTWKIEWDGPGVAWTGLPEPADLSGGGRLAARVAVDPTASEGQRVALGVRDASGREALVDVPADELIELSSTDVERKLWGQQVAVSTDALGAADPALDLANVTHVGLASRAGTGRVFVLDLWHRLDERGSPDSGDAVPQTSPTLRWHRVRKKGYRVTAGVRVSGPTPREDVETRVNVSGFRGNSDFDVKAFQRTITIPAGQRSANSSTLVRTPKRVTNFVVQILPLSGAVPRNGIIRVPTRIPGLG